MPKTARRLQGDEAVGGMVRKVRTDRGVCRGEGRAPCCVIGLRTTFSILIVLSVPCTFASFYWSLMIGSNSISSMNFPIVETGIEGESPRQNKGKNTTTTRTEDTTTTSPASEPTLMPPNKEKLIQPGEHVKVPKPKSRIGPNGETGYIHDPTFLVQNPPAFHIPPSEVQQVCLPPGEGVESPAGAVYLQNIRNHMETSKASRDVKLFCGIYTYHGKTHNTDVVSQTWGKKCDGMLFASDISNSTTGHMHLPSFSRHGFRYDSMVQRMRAIFAYVYDNFLDDYDYFHFCGDDAYIIVENLKEFLASDRVKEWDEVPDQYMIAGFWMNWNIPAKKLPKRRLVKFFKGENWNIPAKTYRERRLVKLFKGEFYLGGGSGYTLSKKALKAYVEGAVQKCQLDTDNAMEDVYFAKCARKFLTTKFIDTRDEFGAHRYHQANITLHANFPTKSNWGAFFTAHMDSITQSLRHMEEQFGFPYFVKDKYISNSSIAFHLQSDPWKMLRMEMLLYKDIKTDCG